MEIIIITKVLGWVSLVNIALLTVSSLLIILFKKPISSLHGKMFNIKEGELNIIFYKYLAAYKILILTFNVAPYLALRIFILP